MNVKCPEVKNQNNTLLYSSYPEIAFASFGLLISFELSFDS